MTWVGLESPGGGAITSGGSGTAGTHIVYINGLHSVDIQVASADMIRVHNGNGTNSAAGNVTLIW
jgi:hypothetical protein